MKIKTNGQERWEELFRRVLEDDLPPEVETGMKRQLAQLQGRMRERELQSRVREAGSGRRVLARAALAFTSILMVIWGSLLQVTGSRSVLAESFSTFKTMVSVDARVRRVESMACRVRVETEDRQLFFYTVEWFSPDRLRLDMRRADGTVVKTLERKGGAEVRRMEQLEDRPWRPIVDLVSPQRLIEQWEGEWQLLLYRREGACEWATFALNDSGNASRTEITVDMCTLLPVCLKKFSPVRLDARFDWGMVQPAGPSIFFQ
jgi:hypothetical protein